MRRSNRCYHLAFATGLALTACVTVNVYFPAAQVEKTAERIVGEIYDGNQPAAEQPNEKPQTKRLGTPDHWTALGWLGPAEAFAAGDATTVSNASIRALKDQIAQRHQQLLPYYQSGQVGISKDGYLDVRDTTGLGLPQTADLKRLIEADNAARRQLYQEVARALNLKPDQVPQVQQIFARQWREKAQTGWWVQTDPGPWTKK